MDTPNAAAIWTPPEWWPPLDIDSHTANPNAGWWCTNPNCPAAERAPMPVHIERARAWLHEATCPHGTDRDRSSAARAFNSDHTGRQILAEVAVTDANRNNPAPAPWIEYAAIHTLDGETVNVETSRIPAGARRAAADFASTGIGDVRCAWRLNRTSGWRPGLGLKLIGSTDPDTHVTVEHGYLTLSPLGEVVLYETSGADGADMCVTTNPRPALAVHRTVHTTGWRDWTAPTFLPKTAPAAPSKTLATVRDVAFTVVAFALVIALAMIIIDPDATTDAGITAAVAAAAMFVATTAQTVITLRRRTVRRA